MYIYLSTAYFIEFRPWLVLLLILGVSLVGKSDHDLVPVHEIMNDKEAKELLENRGIGANNLARILASDPQAKKIGAKPGQVLKIYRKDTGKDNVYYRFVVEG